MGRRMVLLVWLLLLLTYHLPASPVPSGPLLGVGPEELLHEQPRGGGPLLGQLFEALTHGFDEGVVVDGLELHAAI